MQKQRLACNDFLGLIRLIPGAQKDINHWSKKTRIRLPTRTKIKLSFSIPLLLISLRPRPPRKTNAVVEEVIQLLGLMLPR